MSVGSVIFSRSLSWRAGWKRGGGEGEDHELLFEYTKVSVLNLKPWFTGECVSHDATLRVSSGLDRI